METHITSRTLKAYGIHYGRVKRFFGTMEAFYAHYDITPPVSKTYAISDDDIRTELVRLRSTHGRITQRLINEHCSFSYATIAARGGVPYIDSLLADDDSVVKAAQLKILLKDMLENAFPNSDWNGDICTLHRDGIVQTVVLSDTWEAFKEYKDRYSRTRNDHPNVVIVPLDFTDMRLSFTDSEMAHFLHMAEMSTASYTVKSTCQQLVDVFNQNTFLRPVIEWFESADTEKLADFLLNRIRYMGTPNGTGFHPLDRYTLMKGIVIARKVQNMYSTHPYSNIRCFIREYGLTSIADPFAGWGQRMIGACMEGAFYHGNDINAAQVRNLLDMQDYYGIEDALLTYGDSIDWIPATDYDGLFTCPPYLDKEIYTDFGMETLSPQEFEDRFDSIMRRLGHGVCTGIQLPQNMEYLIEDFGSFRRIELNGQGHAFLSGGSRRNREYIYVFENGIG